MNLSQDEKIAYWQEQIALFQKSELTRSEFCRRSSIKLSTFSYWYNLLWKNKRDHLRHFVPVEVVKDELIISKKLIPIKILSRNIEITAEMEANELANFIQLLGLPNA